MPVAKYALKQVQSSTAHSQTQAAAAPAQTVKAADAASSVIPNVQKPCHTPKETLLKLLNQPNLQVLDVTFDPFNPNAQEVQVHVDVRVVHGGLDPSPKADEEDGGRAEDGQRNIDTLAQNPIPIAGHDLEGWDYEHGHGFQHHHSHDSPILMNFPKQELKLNRNKNYCLARVIFLIAIVLLIGSTILYFKKKNF